ncbi:MAG: carboxymuconolactone decarboxylase family protein [Pseudomonadota bacterium]
MPHMPSLPEDATLIHVYQDHPEMAAASLALNQAIMRGPGPFSEAEREAIAAYVSSINACAYCMGVHSGAAVGLGMDENAVGAICERPEAPADPRLAPVLAYVAKLTTAPSTVGPDDIAKITDAGWPETAASSAAQIAALYAFMNRLVEGHGISAPPEKLSANGARIAEIGYDGLAEMLLR